MVASVAGRPVVVEFTDSDLAGWNRIQLDAAPIKGGTPLDIKRTDFVFLEVWMTQVAASPWAAATLQLMVGPSDEQLLVDGDEIELTDHNGVLTTLTAKDSPDPAVPTEFEIGPNVNTTTVKLAAAIDLLVEFKADASSDIVMARVREPGTAGNAAFIDVSNAAAVVLNHGEPAPANFHGGEDRANKPDQEHLYRHGNVESSVAVALLDDLIDEAVGVESAQRVQMQYRLRKTSTGEAVNFKTEPDGFSCPEVLAQGTNDDPVAEYQFVPADGHSVNPSGKSNAAAYNRRDSGLWIAGNGTEESAAALGSLDGYVYAIPMCFVFRRDDAWHNGSGEPGKGEGFHPRLHTNGALLHDHTNDSGVFLGNSLMGNIPDGHSDRPDGAFCDVVVDWDVLDLRRHVLPAGADVSAELRRQMQSLMDGNFFTWAIDGASKHTLGNGSGDVGTQFLTCDELGRDSGHGGNDVTSGDTQHGNLIRNFDHVSRRFGDQQVIERLVVEYAPGDDFAANPGKYVAKAAGVNWHEKDVIHLDLDNLNGTTLNDWDSTYVGTYNGPSGLNCKVSDLMPPGTVITDILSVMHDEGFADGPVQVQDVQLGPVVGLGSNHVELTLDVNHAVVNGGEAGSPDYTMVGDSGAGDVGSPRRIFLEVEVSYPLGVGINNTPDLPVEPQSTDVYPYGALVENDKSQRSPEMEHPTKPLFREGFREVKLEQVSNGGTPEAPIGATTTEWVVSSTKHMLRFPRRVYGTQANQVTVTDYLGTPHTINEFTDVDGPGTEYGSSSRAVQLDLTEPLPHEHTKCRVTYFAQDPIPNHGVNGGGYQVSLYYRSNSPQTCGVKEGDFHTESNAGPLPTELTVEILSQSEEVWSGQIGMGSLELGFPYVAPLDQIPVLGDTSDPTALFPGEWHLCASSLISVDDFDSNTGLLALHPFVQADTTGLLTLGGTTNPPESDIEFRALYPFVDDETYRPTVLSQSLSGITRHKVMYPLLARSTQDSRLFRKGELLLVILTRWGILDDENSVRFTDIDNRTCAAVYRTKDLLLTVGD